MTLSFARTIKNRTNAATMANRTSSFRTRTRPDEEQQTENQNQKKHDPCQRSRRSNKSSYFFSPPAQERVQE